MKMMQRDPLWPHPPCLKVFRVRWDPPATPESRPKVRSLWFRFYEDPDDSARYCVAAYLDRASAVADGQPVRSRVAWLGPAEKLVYNNGAVMSLPFHDDDTNPPDLEGLVLEATCAVDMPTPYLGEVWCYTDTPDIMVVDEAVAVLSQYLDEGKALESIQTVLAGPTGPAMQVPSLEVVPMGIHHQLTTAGSRPAHPTVSAVDQVLSVDLELIARVDGRDRHGAVETVSSVIRQALSILAEWEWTCAPGARVEPMVVGIPGPELDGGIYRCRLGLRLGPIVLESDADLIAE